MLGILKVQKDDKKKRKSVIQERPQLKKHTTVKPKDEIKVSTNKEPVTKEDKHVVQSGEQQKRSMNTDPMLTEKVKFSKIVASKYYEDIDKEPSQTDQKIYQENHLKLDNYDDLMRQIDEFRMRVEQMQDSTNVKTRKTKQLHMQVQQEKIHMNEISQKMELQLNEVLNQAINQMQLLKRDIVSDFADNYNQITKQLIDEVHRTMSNVNAQDALIQEKIDQFSNEMLTKVHEEIMDCKNNSHDLVESLDDQIDGLAKSYITKRTNKLTIITLILTLLNTLGIVAMFLYLTGMWRIV